MKRSTPLLTTRRARQLAAVHQAISVGIECAATQLSAFLGQRVLLAAPRLGLCPVEELISNALGTAFTETETGGEAETVMTGIYLAVTGDVEGHFLILLPPADARQLVAALVAELALNDDQREVMMLSALGEVGNITASSLLNALADATELRITPSCPAVVTDMAGAILELPLLDIAQLAEEALYIETRLTLGGNEIAGSLALIPRPEGLETLIAGLTGQPRREDHV